MANLILPFAVSPPTLSDFIVGENDEILAATQALAEGRAPDASVYVWGDTGAGKSCLLKAACRHAERLGLPTYYVVNDSTSPVDAIPPPLTGLLAVDDVGRLTPAAQMTLFDWHNRAASGGGRYLLAAGDSAPNELPLREELRTRLAGGLVFRLRVLDDADKQQALAACAARRGFTLPAEIADLLLSRLPRNMRSLEAALADLDAFFLSQPLTKRRVNAWLESQLSPPAAGEAAAKRASLSGGKRQRRANDAGEDESRNGSSLWSDERQDDDDATPTMSGTPSADGESRDGRFENAHGRREKVGVLLINLGTPDAPTAAAVRRYLKQFLSDRRVIEAPRWLWWWILRLAVLPFRPRRTAAAYQKIWTSEGSPLLVISRRQRAKLQAALAPTAHVALGMSYGSPSIDDALRELTAANCRRLLALPLYPQTAGSTTGSVFNDIASRLMRWRDVPHLRFVTGYADDPRYIAALADKTAAHRRQHGAADKLLFSFHGTPTAMLTSGDPYHCLCHKTARLTAAALGLGESQWMITFQSRFGRAPWLQPYTDETLCALPRQGAKSVQIVCPGFAADCLETLEEIAVENRDIFLEAGGERYEYIPALNDDDANIRLLSGIVNDAIGDWLAALERNNGERDLQRRAQTALCAKNGYRAD